MSQLGELLKTTREEQGLTLDEVSEKLHIRRHLLEALEENNFNAFPSPVITRGLIRNYARYLKLDPIQALTLYDGNGIVPVKGQRLTPNGIEFMNLSMAPKPLITWDVIIGVLLFLAVIGGAGYIGYTTVIQPPITPTPTKTPEGSDSVDDNAALLLPTVTPTPTGTPTPVPPTDTPTPIVYGGVTVELVIKQPSWIQILADEMKVFEGILQPGERRSWTGQQRVAIRAGNAGGVEIYVNGDYKGIMGGEGQVVDQVWEKVDDPALLTPQPDQANEEGITNTLPPTETPLPVEEPSTAPGSDETPLPLESAPENAETPLPLDSAPESQSQ
ncbi:MAG: helix-turn-helix domain-containing protein [Anaerolineae bacterium]|nr:helix-turn-helix domain-containing protein [Anaerolineae bacterium]